MSWTIETEPGTADSGEWSTQADFYFSDSDQWKTFLVVTPATKGTFVGVTEAPEDIKLDPEDLTVNPEDIQDDESEWTIEPEPD